jgi:hypothetical protein
MLVPATAAQPAPPPPIALTASVGEVTTAGAAPGAVATLPGLALPPAHVALTMRRRPDLNVLAGSTTSIAGMLRPGLPGRMVFLQTPGAHGWRTLARAHTGRGGRFLLRYTPRTIGSKRLRLRLAGNALTRTAVRPLGRLNVYRLAAASWYGGGGGLACGGELTGATLGVANKTLPCGTLVTLRYGDHTVRVPVIDRGPYVAGREFDLTEATKRALGFGDTGEVWSTR